MTKNEEKAIEILKNTRQAWCRILSRYIDNQQKEIEEKSTIIMAGAEKVKQLEKEIEELKKPKYLVHFENNKITKMELINDYISKDKIIEWIDRFELEEDLQDKYDELLGSDAIYKFLKELLEENDE